MNSLELESTVASPIQTIGMSYYFDPATGEHGSKQGLNVFEFYGVGRGGVLGDVSSSDVQQAFWFFHQSAIDSLWNSAVAKVDPITGAASHIEAAYNFADRVFGEIPESTLRGFADATRKVVDAVPQGRYALVDGYAKFPVPLEAAHAAYLGTILLRELRGGVHIDTTREFAIEPNEACYVTNATIFKLHGYSDSDAPEVTDDLTARMAQAEAMTTQVMASYLDVLSDTERVAMAQGVEAMNAAISNPPGADK